MTEKRADNGSTDLSRRQVLAAGGTTLAAASAGCVDSVVRPFTRPEATTENTALVVRNRDGVVQSLSLKWLQGRVCDTSATHRVILTLTPDAEPRELGVVNRDGHRSYTRDVTPGKHVVPLTVTARDWYRVTLVGPNDHTIGQAEFRIEFPNANCK